MNQNPFSSRILGETCCQDQRPQLSSSNLSLSQVIFSKQKDIFLPIRGLSVPTGAGGNFVNLILQFITCELPNLHKAMYIHQFQAFRVQQH